MQFNITTLEELNSIDFNNLPEDEYWNSPDTKEFKMHRIHIYPAKFPALIAQKAFLYAKKNGYNLETVGDIFCGCGTVALEAKIANINFWGTDINPVATLIAYAKTVKINLNAFERRFKKIIKSFYELNYKVDNLNERLVYWFDEINYEKIDYILTSINTINRPGKYRKIFQIILSSTLKSTSRWLNSSIKPTIDPNKETVDPMIQFIKQTKKFVEAYKEIESLFLTSTSYTKLINSDIRKVKRNNLLDAIITSPPYVTSYEYADLHQLSSLWLGFTEDFTTLRKNTIGSIYSQYKSNYTQSIKDTPKNIVNSLNLEVSKKNMIAKYYVDMNQVVTKCWNLLKQDGFVLIVIGNTMYKDTQIKNAESISEMMIKQGFTIVEISKRKISSKFLPSHRDEKGKFTSDTINSRKIYNQEYIIIGKK